MISLPSGTLNLSPPDAINIARDPMQNPGQTRIFYKAGQTRMTQMTRPGFNPGMDMPVKCILIMSLLNTPHPMGKLAH